MAIKLIIGLIVAVVALAVMYRANEPGFALFPAAGESTTPAAFGVPFDASTIQTSDGERLRGWALPHPRPRALVVYFHGNGGNLSVWTPILVGVQRHGYAVRAIDYRGYGASTGQPSERGLYRDVDAAIEWARTAAPRDVPIVYWGRSLGTAMAAYAAAAGRTGARSGLPRRTIALSRFSAAGVPQPVLVVPFSHGAVCERGTLPRARHSWGP